MVGAPSNPNCPIISVVSTDEDIVIKVGRIFGTRCCKIDRHNPKWKLQYTTKTHGRRAIEFMKLLLPLMGEKRQKQITKAINSYDINSVYVLSKEDIYNIKKLCSKKKKTQGEIAKLYNISRETVNKIHNNKRPNYIMVAEPK